MLTGDMTRGKRVHYRRPGGHKTECGLRVYDTTFDTTLRNRVTCQNCIRVVQAEARRADKDGAK